MSSINKEEIKAFINYFKQIILSFEEPHFKNYKELFLKLIKYNDEYLDNNIIKKNKIIDKIAKTLNLINKAYKKLYYLIVKFTYKYIEYSTNKLILIELPEKSQEIINEQYIQSMIILKYDFLFKMLEYYIYFLCKFKILNFFTNINSKKNTYQSLKQYIKNMHINYKNNINNNDFKNDFFIFKNSDNYNIDNEFLSLLANKVVSIFVGKLKLVISIFPKCNILL